MSNINSHDCNLKPTRLVLLCPSKKILYGTEKIKKYTVYRVIGQMALKSTISDIVHHTRKT